MASVVGKPRVTCVEYTKDLSRSAGQDFHDKTTYASHEKEANDELVSAEGSMEEVHCMQDN